MTAVSLPVPRLHAGRDSYGHARMPRNAAMPEPEHIDRVPYGRFRNVYLYITEACQLRCEHCYMGERLDRALKMPLPRIIETLATWRRLGGSKLTILGGEPTLHPDYCASIRAASQLGYEHVITTTNAQRPALRKFRQLEPSDFAYVQVSVDGGSASSHDVIRGRKTFDTALATTAELAQRGFDTRIICTVNQANRDDALQLLDIADELNVSLVKFPRLFDYRHRSRQPRTGHDTARMGRVLRLPQPGRAHLPDAGVVPADIRPA
jgi:MoaA/NifB/PqqE/SkfB family radical SAM enzyme